jgi:hypothetical protein
MLLVGCYWWTDKQWSDVHSDGFHYKPHHVRHLKDMVKRNLTVPHEFVCITDQPHVFDADRDIRPVVLDRTTHVPGKEWAKLMTFHPNGRELFGGDKLLQLDLDGIVCGNLDPIVNRTEDIVVWRNPARVPWNFPKEFARRAFYNGSVILHSLGTEPCIWNEFVPNATEVMEYLRDTQIWMSKMLGPEVPYWDANDGIYRLERDDTPGSGIAGPLPENARLVFFPGSAHKPWIPEVRAALPWIADYWPEEPALEVA